jgi:hypothetical protein
MLQECAVLEARYRAPTTPKQNVRHWAGNIAMETRTLATRFTIKTTWDTMAAANGGLPAICPKRMRIDQMHAQGGRRFKASRGHFF